MTKRIVHWRASRQIDAIREHIARDNIVAAVAVADRINAALEFLTLYPHSGHRTVRKGLRMFVVNPYPYVIFFRYRLRRDEVVIESVQHAAMRRPGLADEYVEFRAATMS